MKFAPLDALPLFADDLSIGAAVLGRARAGEFKGIVPLLERRGFPRVDEQMGGRYVPAVKAFFDREYGLIAKDAAPRSPDGNEDLSAWNATTKAAQKRRA